MALAPNKLPKKDFDVFRDLVQCYENKQFKKGIKLANSLLLKHPNHGETEAMKGLICNNMGRKEEGYELVKLGLKHDIKSSVCWHVYGLIHKSDNNFKEAIKCYLNALKFDPDSQLILKDLSFLQVQMRDAAGFLNTRGKILETRPQLRGSWIGYAIANYLTADYETAFTILMKYMDTISDKGDNYEESEVILFQNRCLEQQGKYQQAIDHLKKKQDNITDKYFIRIKTAELHLYQHKYDVALTEWTKLVKEQSENYRFHIGLQCVLLRLDIVTCKEMFELTGLELPSTTLCLTSEQKQMIYSYYQLQNIIKSRAIKKIVLDICSDDDFASMVDQHMRKSIESGVPALYEDICSLIRIVRHDNPSRMMIASNPMAIRDHRVTKIVLSIIDDYIQNLSLYSSFDAPSTSSIDNGASFESIGEHHLSEAAPNALLWSKFLKCHLYDISGYLHDALILIDECISHTPTALDMYLKKASLLRKVGETQLAANIMDYARSLDLQDRYLNNETTRYLLQANRIPDGMNRIALFTKHDGDSESILYELQCSWYELEAAEAYARVKDYGMALKKFYAIRKHFLDFIEDMFDFHGYCIRKGTIRMYLDLMLSQDEQYGHKFYQRAYEGALQIFLMFMDHPETIPVNTSSSATSQDSDDIILSTTSSSSSSSSSSAPSSSSSSPDKKTSAPSSSSAKVDNNHDNTDKDDDDTKEDADEPIKTKDDDPYGWKLLSKDFLSESYIWSTHFDNKYHHCSMKSLCYYAIIQGRKKNVTESVAAMKEGLHRISSSNVSHIDLSELVITIVQLYVQYSDNDKSLWDELLSSYGSIDSFVSMTTDVLSSTIFDIAYAKLVSYSYHHPERMNIDILLTPLKEGCSCGVNIDTFTKVLKFVQKKFGEDEVEAYMNHGKEIFPTADIFKSADELAIAVLPVKMESVLIGDGQEG